MEGEYLSKIVDLKDFEKGVLNLVTAPCGAGKTYFALNCLPQLVEGEFKRQHTLYLIDTVAGNEQLLKNKECRVYDWVWRVTLTEYDDLCWEDGDDKITVMTYACFGTLCKHLPGWYRWLDLIICDELHNLVNMCQWERLGTPDEDDQICQYAAGVIAKAATLGEVSYVVALTATPEKVRKEFGFCVKDVPLHGVPRHYTYGESREYNNLAVLCTQLPKSGKGLVYVSHIRHMNKHMEILRRRGFRVEGLWSTHNKEFPMSKEQYAVRDYLIKHEAIPEDIDVLFINKSYETSINIKSHIDYIVVHSAEEDVVTQAIGRYRNDVDRVYFYSEWVIDDLILPEDMLGKALYSEDFRKFAEEYELRDRSGRVMKKPSLVERLRMSGYTVCEKKIKNGRRYVVITKGAQEKAVS